MLTEQDKKDLRKALDLIDQVSKRNKGKNLIRNFVYREEAIADILSEAYHEKITTVTGKKHDAEGSQSGNWEFKTTTAKQAKLKKYKDMLLVNGSFEIDKMDEEAKLPEVEAIDAWAFGIFEGIKYNPAFVLVIKKRELVNKFLTKLVIPRHNQILVGSRSLKAKGKRIVRDSVRFTAADLINTLGEDLVILNPKSARVSLISFLTSIKLNGVNEWISTNYGMKTA